MAENNFSEIESKWQKFWAEHPELYEAKDLSTGSGQGEKEGQTQGSALTKKYVLVEFPYPSGLGLHVGHAFTFTGGDVYARFNRMKGLNVLFPMGWDAFGLPTENYAIKTKQKPQKVTKDNTDMFRSQMKRLAFSFDWSREINTTDPNYYKWTQWIFIQLFKKGLAYKQEMPINWCPSCKIGLANEEVVNGKCERCGSEVERRTISQWVLRITKYADRLLDGLAETDFETKIKAAQINWIGKSEGAKVKFQISNFKFQNEKESILEVFTTRPDTLYGATFMVVAPEHELVTQIMNNQSPKNNDQTNSNDQISNEQIEKIKNYVKQARSKSELERTELSRDKTGVFSGLYAINPATGEEIPIWISDFVLASYGTGAIMSVPAHDERDFDFAKKFGLEIVPVVEKDGNPQELPVQDIDGGKMINSEFLDGLSPKEAIIKMITWLEEKGIGKRSASYHLRDWIFSRQHYWGEPIPMIFCEHCAMNQIANNQNDNDINEKIEKYAKENNIEVEVLKNNPGWYPVEEGDLPVKLPEVEAYEPTDDGQSPLSKIPEFVKTKCPVCGKEAKRETDTMPNWAGSDWYFMRYIDPNNDAEIASQELLKKWLPVDVYIGGDEHTTLHLLYSRFIYKFLFDIGVAPTSEPYKRRMNHGVILGPDGQRMSKSHGNVIVPEVVADKYGVDATRMYLMFMGPFDATMAWNENTLMGVKRFLDRWKKFVGDQLTAKSEQDNEKIKVIINKLIKGVGDDLASFKFNTAIAKLMEGLNQLTITNYAMPAGRQELRIEEIKNLIKLIAPLAPYTAEEMWSQIRSEDDPISVHAAAWPECDKKYLTEETVQIPVAVNGKVREQLIVDSNELGVEKEIINKAKKLEKIKQWIEGKEIVKEIYVMGKMVNFVVR